MKNKIPLYLYYAAFFGIYKEGEIVTDFDGNKYLISNVICDGKMCGVSINPLETINNIGVTKCLN